MELTENGRQARARTPVSGNRVVGKPHRVLRRTQAAPQKAPAFGPLPRHSELLTGRSESERQQPAERTASVQLRKTRGHGGRGHWRGFITGAAKKRSFCKLSIS